MATAAPPFETDHPSLTGHLAPVSDELVVDRLPVTGKLPEGLVGTFRRNGPNAQFAPLGGYHIFDGDGMVHAVELDGQGGARYRNRWIESKGLLAERRAGHALFGSLSDFRLPDEAVMAEVGPMKNTANTHIVRHAGRIFALMEAARPTELSEELDTLGEYDFGGELRGPMTAHPKIDPETGEMVFFGYNPFPPYLRYHVADPSGSLVTSVDIDLPAPVMMHDFAITENLAVFFDLPGIFDVQALLSGGDSLRWEPENGTRLGLLDRSRPEAGVRWFEAETFWMFHVLNAYEEGSTVVVDACRADRVNTSFSGEMTERISPHLHRWRIDTTTGKVTDEPLDDRAADFPRINDAFAGRNARYGYLGHTREWGAGEAEFDGVTKHDLVAGTSRTHLYGDDAVAGETVFAADPEGRAEDDGWLLTFVHDRSVDASHLVVVDAPTLEEVARVHLPRRVPFGFHGDWFPAV